jgi:hypothetical protein
MNKELTKKLESAIESLAHSATTKGDPEEAEFLTRAAANLANALLSLSKCESLTEV